jgi:hypothetical protein
MCTRQLLCARWDRTRKAPAPAPAAMLKPAALREKLKPTLPLPPCDLLLRLLLPPALLPGGWPALQTAGCLSEAACTSGRLNCRLPPMIACLPTVDNCALTEASRYDGGKAEGELGSITQRPQ